MTDIPLDAVLEAGLVNEGDFADDVFFAIFGVLRESIGGAPGTELTIAGGAIAPTRWAHSVDTEANDPTDNLDAIGQAVHPSGRVLLLYAETASRVVTIRHGISGTGRILLADGLPFVLSSTERAILLRRDGADWREVMRTYGGPASWRAGLAVPFFGITAKTASWSVAAADVGRLFTITASSAGITATLPAANAVAEGQTFAFKRMDASGQAISVARAGSDTIDGGTSVALTTRYQTLLLQSNGSNGWNIVADARPPTTLNVAGLATGGGSNDVDRTITVAKATAAQIRTLTDDATAITPKGIADAAAVVDDGDKTGSVTLDIDGGFHRKMRATGNITFQDLTNIQPGQTVMVRVAQDGTGSRTISYNTAKFKKIGGAFPVVGSTATTGVTALQFFAATTSEFWVTGGPVT